MVFHGAAHRFTQKEPNSISFDVVPKCTATFTTWVDSDDYTRVITTLPGIGTCLLCARRAQLIERSKDEMVGVEANEKKGELEQGVAMSGFTADQSARDAGWKQAPGESGPSNSEQELESSGEVQGDS